MGSTFLDEGHFNLSQFQDALGVSHLLPLVLESAYYVCLRNHAYPSSGSYPGPGLGVQTTNVQPIHHSTSPLIDFAQSISQSNDHFSPVKQNKKHLLPLLHP
ncbi:hypothetical protein PGT21_019066 [Puccinia graminis f. sp. tritici]|uniref:Uncharacterized protein n=1 Tax=Puccinia graminis f. sp. tritici TaxID=56615 RepID=A0A5B0Q626_PUCGR|nr:hypothetical protein PGT21_019066 [Puccinia graminis f. sp. tritici]